ncbi:hypothetical protein GLYMA_01G151050v4 [Glycine max]|nr:hypothetical protein GLYMA_01G151050v4 [Glycine max]KAH1163195.1 hypothetical protein GYH30_001638 [Glycine max]
MEKELAPRLTFSPSGIPSSSYKHGSNIVHYLTIAYEEFKNYSKLTKSGASGRKFDVNTGALYPSNPNLEKHASLFMNQYYGVIKHFEALKLVFQFTWQRIFYP